VCSFYCNTNTNEKQQEKSAKVSQGILGHLHVSQKLVKLLESELWRKEGKKNIFGYFWGVSSCKLSRPLTHVNIFDLVTSLVENKLELEEGGPNLPHLIRSRSNCQKAKWRSDPTKDKRDPYLQTSTRDQPAY